MWITGEKGKERGDECPLHHIKSSAADDGKETGGAERAGRGGGKMSRRFT